MITLKNLSKIYNSNGSVAVGLQNISITFNKGEFVGIVGPSGSGKTTLLNVVSGMDTYEEGELVLFGSETSSYTQEDFEAYRRNNVSFIFQNYQLIDSYSVLDNVVMELLFKGMDLSSAKVSAREILTRVGLSHRLKNRASKLSGGEKQRVVIARALASDCQILACDEPTGNLDSKNSVEIINLLKEIGKDKLVLMVTHEPDLIKDVATRIVTVKDGLIDSDEVKEVVVEDEVSTLSKDHINFFTRFYLGVKTLISTPKRTIMLTLLFLILSFGATLMVGGALTVETSYGGYSYDSLYDNITDNRVVVYNDSSIDISKYTKDAVKVQNDFFLDSRIQFADINIEGVDDDYLNDPFLGVLRDNTEVMYGRQPESSDEIILELPMYNMYNIDESTLDVDNTVSIEKMISENNYEKVTYKIVGFSVSSDYNPRVYFYENDFSGFSNSLSSNINNDIVYTLDDRVISVDSYSVFEDDTKIYVSDNFDGKDLGITIGTVDFDYTAYSYEYVGSNSDIVVIPSTILLDFLEDNVCRSSYYFEDGDAASEANKLINEAGVDSLHPGSFTIDDEFTYYFSLFSTIFVYVSEAVLLFGLLFIVSVIANLILKTTVKDFTIMRIIGLNKRDILEMILIQTSVMGVCTYGLMWIIILIINMTKFGVIMQLSYLIEMISPLNVIFTSIFVILLCSLYIGYRHHNKMFKTSASQNLRGGDLL